MKNYIDIFDCYAGCGGLSAGFMNEGYKIKYANEIDENFASTYLSYHSDTIMFNEDINDVIQKIQDKEKGYPSSGEIDMVIGGPPCQGFSGFNRYRDISDNRNSQIENYYKIIELLVPQCYVMENVSGILSLEKGEAVKKIYSKSEKLGYVIKLGVLQAGYYGLPQNRWRVFLVAYKNRDFDFRFPYPTHNFPKIGAYETKGFRSNVIRPIGGGLNLFEDPLSKVTVYDAISDLPELKMNDKYEGPYLVEPKSKYQEEIRCGSNGIHNHETQRAEEITISRINALPDKKNAGWYDLPIELQPKNLKKRNAKDYPNRFGRLEWDGIFNTIVGKIEPYWSRVIHPEQKRLISIRECARAQGLPDSMIFNGTFYQQIKQVGNAVPVPLAAKLAKSIKNLF